MNVRLAQARAIFHKKRKNARSQLLESEMSLIRNYLQLKARGYQPLPRPPQKETNAAILYDMACYDRVEAEDASDVIAEEGAQDIIVDKISARPNIH